MKIVEEDLGIQTGPFTIEEIRKAVRKMKTGKAAGPDGIPMEYLKAMGEDNTREVLSFINRWYEAEEIPQDILEAQVVLIFKKGDASDLANYRPISLLNAVYKVLASMIQTRLAETNRPSANAYAVWFQER